MENLSDVEFGSDKNAEEAPILVAQRYLNIFRQMHIFNQEKKTQFDDELLALPQNILDFFKRMPGGRLLVEHIEDVKTQRGISFVKANKDEFSNGMDDAPTAGDGSGGGAIGGNVVMDSSFAETLATSLASAFKQIPSSSAPANISGATISADFGNAFDIIAEEIKTSRASLLDVLKETKNITDSVIASQVSISRILEGILSSQNRDNSDVTELNNRIIASQASITKLLEGLYSSNIKKNDEISSYLNLDNKLQDFRKDITQTVNASLQQFNGYSHDAKNSVLPSVANAGFDIEKRLSIFKNEIKSEMENTLKEIKSLLGDKVSVANDILPYSESEKLDTSSEKDSPLKQDFVNDGGYVSSSDETSKKKKKKKKKHGQEQSVSSVSNSASSAVVSSVDDIASKDDFGTLDGVVYNSEYNHEDDFNNIHLDESPLDIQSLDNIEDINTFGDSSENDLKALEDLPLPKEEKNNDNLTADNVAGNEHLNSLLSDDDSSLDTISVDNGLSDIEDIKDDFNSSSLEIDDTDDLDFALPEGVSNQAVSTENIFTDHNDEVSTDAEFADGLDFALPEQGVALKKGDQTKSSAATNSDDIQLSDFLTDNIEPDGMSIEDSESLNSDEKLSLTGEETLDNLTLDETASDEEKFSNLADISVQNTENDLNSFLNNESASEVNENNLIEANDDEVAISESDNLSSFADEQEDDEPQNEQNDNDSSQSRYSAELNKIREALTSNSVDISSLDEPIRLDDYSDDENLEANNNQEASSENDEWEYDYVEDNSQDDSEQEDTREQKDDENWEWEYVDENGNVVKQQEQNNEDEDWEWEYVEDTDETSSEDEEKHNPE